MTSDLAARFDWKKFGPWIVSGLVIVVAVILLRMQDRIWWCVCGNYDLWRSDPTSSHNSQHLFDPYSITHVTHGILFYGALFWLARRLATSWQFCIAIAVEALWEVVENTNFVIDRYRETAAQGYTGDSIFNCLGDIASCAFGFWIAMRLGFWRSVAIIVVTEFALLITIKDSLLLSALMLIYPFDVIKQWQIS